MIFLYHSIADDAAPSDRCCIGQALPLKSFQRHVEWLSRSLHIVPLDEYLKERKRDSRRGGKFAALTFDDGVGSTFRRVFPFLQENRLPATFFVSTGHLEGGPLLWFCYLNALCFENTYEEISAEGRSFSLKTLGERIDARRALEGFARRRSDPTEFTRELEAVHPVPVGLREEYGGMTNAQLKSAGSSSYVEIGSHSVTHPFLSRKSRTEQADEISRSGATLAALTGRPVRYFAYPSGDYNPDTLKLLREAEIEAGFATISRKIEEDDGRFEIERIGIYSPPLWKVKLKAWGAVPAARRLGIQIG